MLNSATHAAHFVLLPTDKRGAPIPGTQRTNFSVDHTFMMNDEGKITGWMQDFDQVYVAKCRSLMDA